MDKILEAVGDEWTWEFMRTDGGNWYAWATHTNDQEHFKFTSSNKSLVLAAADVALQIQNDGPNWARPASTQQKSDG